MLSSCYNILRHAIWSSKPSELVKEWGWVLPLTNIPDFVFRRLLVTKAVSINILPRIFLRKRYFVGADSNYIPIPFVKLLLFFA